MCNYTSIQLKKTGCDHFFRNIQIAFDFNYVSEIVNTTRVWIVDILGTFIYLKTDKKKMAQWTETEFSLVLVDEHSGPFEQIILTRFH